MTDTTPPARILFDGVLTGDTARAVAKAAEGLNVHDLLADALLLGLAKLAEGTDRRDVSVSPWTCNDGNNGFHLTTVVADGYGNLVAEDTNGKEMARVEVTYDEDGDDTQDPVGDLARLMKAYHTADEAQRNA